MTSAQTQPPATTRRQRRRLEIELRLLDASKRLFIEKGYDETTVAEIAETADVAYGTFVNYFPAKSDLLAAMGEREVGELSEQLSTLARHPGRIDETLTLLFDSFAKRLEAASPRERALAAKIQSIAFAAAPEDRVLGYQDGFAAFIRQAVTSGRVRADEFHATGTVAELSVLVDDLSRDLHAARDALEAADSLANDPGWAAEHRTWTVGTVAMHAYEELAQHLGHLELTVDLVT